MADSADAPAEATPVELPAEAVAQAAGDVAAEGGEASPASPTETEADDSPVEKVVRRGPPITRQASKEIIEGIRRKRSSSICESNPGDDTQEKLDAEEAKWRIPAGFFYDPSSPDLCPTLEERELPRSATKASRFMGYDFSRVNNAVWTSNEEFAYISGHVVCFMNIQTRQRRFLHGRDSGGIGAIAMSPDLIYFAAAERSIASQPNVYIYSFKTMRLYRILRKGTSKGYASVAFSPHNKNHLAALGCAPDYLLSVWDWRNERLLLKCKAYGQEIYSIRWGQFPGILTSVGVGHIRFWKMATTFTGLKLQGDLGKFGASELSDISGFVELPDGKVVTGSEYGKLLLWEGVFVKVELMRAKDSVTQADAGTSIAGCPHAGNIDVILMDRENGMVISGGDDGHLRWWPIEEIDTAEADYDNGILEFGIRMRKEIRIPPSSDGHHVHPAHIQHVVVGQDETTWLIQDSRNGMIWIFDMTSGTCTSALSCHSRQVTGSVISSSYAGLVMSCGMDGTVRAFNVSQPWDNELYRDCRPLENTVGAACMDATPELVDPSKRTVCAGYTDGTIRAFTACSDGFLQLQALKPHNCMVKQLKYSPDEFGLLATLGEDNTLFFFQVQLLSEHAIPIGFVTIPAPVNYFSWDDMSGKVLLSLGDGSLVALSSPNLDSVNNSETYEIQVNYTALMPDVPEIEESDEEEEDEEEGEANEGEEGEASPTATEAPTEAEGEEEEGKKKKKKKKEDKEKPKDDDEDEEKHVEVVVTAVSRAIFIPGDGDDSERKVIFTGTGKYAGGLWECSMVGIEETRISEVPLAECTPPSVPCLLRIKIPPNVQVTHMSLSPALNWIILGFADGRVWLVPRVHGGTFACVHVSDGLSGAVNSVSMLEDESMMLVAAGDGTLVTYLVSDGLLELAEIKSQGKEVNMSDAALELENAIPEMPDMSMEGWSLPPKETPGVLAINPDITDSEQYSIQDAKLKAEEDSAKAAAELKKLRVRERINEIRNELAELQAKNNQLHEAQLSNTDMVVDQEYINHLKEDMENQIEQVRFELAWLVEFHERGLQKLKDYYLKQVDFERVEVLGFQSDHRVSTFRCAKMSSELQANLARLHELIFAAGEGDAEEEDDDGDDGFGFDGKSTLRGHKTDLGFDGTDHAGSQNTEKPLSGAEQRELRRQQRMLRKAQMQELERAKPSESYEAPEDVEAIANAEATLGNYMLKTSQDYQVPENQRMNAEKKRRQMFLLEESIHAIKTEFNQRVMALRDFRQQVRAEVQRDLQALAEIDEQLGTTTSWVVGVLENPPGAPPEFPETRFHLEDGDIKAFASKLRGDPEESHATEEQFDEEDEEEGDDEVDGEVELEEGEEEAGDEKEEETGRKSSLKKGKGSSQPSVPLSGRAALAARRVGRLTLRGKLLQETSIHGDPLSQAVNVESQARLRHDKGQLEEHVRQVVDTFNMAVASIEKEKAKLESDLKNAEMKLLVLYEELLTLNELEEKDETLLKKATKCRQDKTSVMHQIKECQDQLSEKKAEIEEWHTQEQNLQAEFTDLVGENSPFLSALLKVYKKKVKRSKRKKGGEEEDFDEDEEDEDDEGSDIESDEDEDMEDDDTGPPQGCDHQIYESVIDLRDKRLEMEDALQEIQKAVEGLKQTHKKLLDDERRIDKEQKMTDAEIQQFQTDKQRKLNQVPIVFALRLSQVQCLAPDEGDAMERMPAELGEQVIFTNEGLKRLMSRITELHQEIKEVKARHKQLQRDFRVRKKDKNVALQHIEDLHGKFQDIQMLKFGQIVDLDLIERSAPNKYVQELQEKVLQAEAEHRRRIAEWQKRMEKQKKELTKITCDNTSLMEQIVSMGYSQMQLDAALNARIANVTVNDNEPLNELREMERDRCKDLLSLQSKEIATLKAEINLFRKKGGHIYTTVTANRQ